MYVVTAIAIPFFLNQLRACLRPARDWFLEIAFIHDVSMFVCVCVCPRPQGY